MITTGSPSYSLTLRIRLPNRPGSFALVAEAIGSTGAVLGSIDLVSADRNNKVRDVVVLASSEEHEQKVVAAVKAVPGVKVLHVHDRTTQVHIGGKLEIHSKRPLRNYDDLSMVYTPGVARICKMTEKDPAAMRQLTIKGNSVAVVTDGTAVLGLGDIGPCGAMPVMEGKAVLFKEFGNVDAYPICLATKDVDEIVRTVVNISPGFGGINLEDISAPRCFDVEERLIKECDIPIFHDDQHGTAVVVLAALLNALKVVGKSISELRIAVAGAGASGTAVTSLLIDAGVKDIVCVGRTGILHPDEVKDAHPKRRWLAEVTNPRRIKGSLADAVRGANMFIGLAQAGLLTVDMLKTMAPEPIIFAMSNPVPEIMPEEAAPYARIIATGRSDYPNQINNVLCFPGFFRGMLDCGARKVTTEMKLAAAHAIANSIPEDHLSEELIIPSVFNKHVGRDVARAVASVACE